MSARKRKERPSDPQVFEAIQVRLAGFRLIEAGSPEGLDIDCLVHMLQLASKTGATLSELGKYEMASSVLASAAKFEQSLRNTDDPQNIHRQAKAQATVVYYCSRMEAAWKEGNDSLAQYMLQNITGRELLASKVLEIGRSLLAGGSRDNEQKIDARAEEAVKWMQKAFSLAEHLDDTMTAGAAELKVGVVDPIARAYVLSSSLNTENLARAETSLNELLNSVPPDDQKNAANQELRWWKLAVLKRRNASEGTLLEAFRSIINHMDFTEDNVTKLVVKIIQICLRASLGAVNNSGLPFVERLLLAMIFHCSKDVDHPGVMMGATHQLFYQYGERKLSLKRYSDAVDWFLLGTQQAFVSIADTCASKCYRKAALCHIEQQEYAQASSIIRRCPGDESATHYLTLLVAVKQAIRAVQAMVHGSCFDQRMLLMATRLAHESDLKNLLLSVLQELLNFVRDQKVTQVNVEPVTLVRCMIRLVLRLIADPANAGDRFCHLGPHDRAKTLVETACKEKRLSFIIKDVSWLWRTAYNCAAQGCTEWDNAEDRVPPLFDVSRELLESYFDTALEVDEEMYLCVVFSSFAATSARGVSNFLGFCARLTPIGSMVDSDKLGFTAREIQNCEERLRKILEKGVIRADNIPRVLQCLGVLLMFEAELACRMREWQVIPMVVQKVAQCQAPLCDTFEAIADMLWSAQECPLDVLFVALEAILHASLDRNALSVEKFARWLRAICTMLLARNAAPDRLKAIGYVEQAISVLEEHGGDDDGDEAYPMDERYWLLTSSYNTGIECLHVCLLDDARRWFEASSRICRFVPDGAVRAKKITETYTHLMNRYGS
ncbi:hypothetical protein BC834DRAFT_922404 [Gloeopeniophorella convolvens]|nr:hypothetical protein BC834DRAFT_922404 [Gloeopeniophorella convolvens]